MKSGTNALNARPSGPFIPTVPSVPVPKPVWARFSTAMAHLMDRAVAYFSGQNAPRIQERRDRTGTVFFKIYDPVTEKSHHFSSEAEVRTWLDERYSR